MSIVSITSDEIVVDFTRNLNKTNSESPEIKLIDRSYIFPAISNASKKSLTIDKYKMNLFYLQCSCSDFKESVKLYPRRDIRRICKHLYYKIITQFENEIDPLSKMLLDNKFWMHETEVHKIKLEKQIIYLGFYNNEKIINIYKYTDRWRQYQFSLEKGYWINNATPFNKDYLNRTLELFLTEYDPSKN